MQNLWLILNFLLLYINFFLTIAAHIPSTSRLHLQNLTAGTSVKRISIHISDLNLTG